MKQTIHLHKCLLIIAIILLKFDCSAQYRYHPRREFHWKLVTTISAGPETILAFPPKVSYYAFEPFLDLFYGGLDLNIGFFGFSNSIGGTIGFQYKSLVLENSVSRTSIHQYKRPNAVWMANNLKIGFEYKSFSMKAGPSFILKEKYEHHPATDIIKIGEQRFNIEIGFVINSKYE